MTKVARTLVGGPLRGGRGGARRRRRPSPGGRAARLFRAQWLFLGVLGTYLASAAMLNLSKGDTAFLHGALLLDVSLLVFLTLAGIWTPRPSGRALTLAAALLPMFTLARLIFFGTIPLPAVGLLSYLFMTIGLAYVLSTPRAPPTEGRRRGSVYATEILTIAAPIGFLLAFAGIFLSPDSLRGPAPGWAGVAIAGTVAFIDEFYFRGVLQPALSGDSTPVAGWMTTTALFGALAATQGGAGFTAFQTGLGFALGVLVLRPHRLSLVLALTARVVTATVAATLLLVIK